MYIGYLQDRKKLKFSCVKDNNAAKLISDLERGLSVVIIYFIYKSKQVCIVIFSRETLVSICILVNVYYIGPSYDPSLPSPYGVEQCSVIKSDNSRFLNASEKPADFILNLTGGSEDNSEQENEFISTEQEKLKLVRSLLSKVPNSNYSEVSISNIDLVLE